MNNLLIDIGNSDVKAGISKAGKHSIKFTGRFSYVKENFNKDFENNFNDFKINCPVDRIGISVLIGKDNDFLNNFFRKKFNISPFFIDRDSKLPLQINYSEGLGNDRICSASAAVKLYENKNILIIDFGTATTFTLISNKVLTGGLISPGIGTSLESLTGKTSLPLVKIGFPKKLFSNNTIDNIKAGVLYQSLYSAERIVKEAGRLYENLFVIGTGGYSKLLSSKTELINTIDKHLVLKGINFIIS